MSNLLALMCTRCAVSSNLCMRWNVCVCLCTILFLWMPLDFFLLLKTNVSPHFLMLISRIYVYFVIANKQGGSLFIAFKQRFFFLFFRVIHLLSINTEFNSKRTFRVFFLFCSVLFRSMSTWVVGVFYAIH